MNLSPLTVPYRILQRGASVAVAAAVAVASGASALVGAIGGVAVAVVLVGVAVLALVGYELARYRRYEYELTADTFDIRSGVFARRNREIPLRRIQNVDIRRGVVQRLLGIAAVDFETAGGSETEAAIRYVSFEEAKRLQGEIRRLKRGAATAGRKPPRRANSSSRSRTATCCSSARSRSICGCPESCSSCSPESGPCSRPTSPTRAVWSCYSAASLPSPSASHSSRGSSVRWRR
ncbi:PH domain-containing protein [Haloplanus sp. GCM10025708]|uniref:PH domain-containing protein n=1 Tax=Haloplanus sp. GCM10025708 TaxID=3252679 RepID=UPI00361172BB